MGRVRIKSRGAGINYALGIIMNTTPTPAQIREIKAIADRLLRLAEDVKISQEYPSIKDDFAGRRNALLVRLASVEL